MFWYCQLTVVQASRSGNTLVCKSYTPHALMMYVRNV